MSARKFFSVVLFVGMLILFVLVTAKKARAETTVTPYASVAAYHLDCRSTACDMSYHSDTPATVDFGLRFTGALPFLVDSIDLGYHHMSYLDKGETIGGLGNDKPEEVFDMYGLRLNWKIDKLSFSF